MSVRERRGYDLSFFETASTAAFARLRPLLAFGKLHDFFHKIHHGGEYHESDGYYKINEFVITGVVQADSGK